MEILRHSDIEFVSCPIATAFAHVQKRWTVNILRDMFRGVTKFSDFLLTNPGLSTRMLALRLRDLEADNIIYREAKHGKPPQIVYGLTQSGFALNKVLYELAMYSYNHHLRTVVSDDYWEVPEGAYSERLMDELKLS